MSSTAIEPYLSMLRRELATSLMPRDDDNAQRIAIYAHHVLTQLLLKSSVLPALQATAMGKLDGLLDGLNAHLRSIEFGMVLTGDLTQHIRNKPDFATLEPVLQTTIRVLLANPGATSKTLVRQISAILLEMQEAFNQATLKEEIKPDSGGSVAQPALTDTQRQSLQAWMRQRFNEPALEIGAIRAITGGGSKKTLILDLLGVRQSPPSVVVRADQSEGVVESSVRNEFPLIETLFAAGLPVPQPFASETDASIIGGAFNVVGHLAGRNIGDHLVIYEPSVSFGRDLARAMGIMHAIPPEKFGDRIPGATTSTIERVRQDTAMFETIWRNSGYPSVALELSYAWVKDHLHFAEGRRALNHCDIGCHNMLAKDGRLAAILDWETMIISNPAHDLAYVHPLIVQMMPWEEFLAEYEKAGGTIPSAKEFDFYLMWTAIFRIGYQFIARSFFESGLSSSVVLALGTQHIYQHCEHALYKVLNYLDERY